MALIEINTQPTLRQLRQFGGLWLAVFSVLAALAWRAGRHPTLVVAMAGIAVLVPVVGWLAPRFMRWVWIGMSAVAWPIGTVVSFTVLTLVYFGVVTPLGLVMRVSGRDSLERRFEPDMGSYWSARVEERSQDPRSYLRQF